MKVSIYRVAVTVFLTVLAACGGGGESSDDSAAAEARTSQGRLGMVSVSADGAKTQGRLDRPLLQTNGEVEGSVVPGQNSLARTLASRTGEGAAGIEGTVVALAAKSSGNTSAKWLRTVYRVRGATASAQMSVSTTCVNLNVQVSASEKMTRDGGSTTPAVGVIVAVSGLDACRGSLIDASMEVPGATFSGTVSDATAQVSMPVNLYQMVEVDGVWIRVDEGNAILNLRLVWTGSGTSYLSRTFEMNSSPTGVVRNRYWGRWQEAGISAAVSYDGEWMVLMDSVGTTGVFVAGTSEVIRY